MKQVGAFGLCTIADNDRLAGMDSAARIAANVDSKRADVVERLEPVDVKRHVACREFVPIVGHHLRGMRNVGRSLPAFVAGSDQIGEMDLEDIALADPQDHRSGTLVGAQPDLAGASAVVGGGDCSQRLAVMDLVASDDVTAQRED